MPIDAAHINEIFSRLGQALRKPAHLCLIGSTPGIATGQSDRQTPDIDVWHASSAYDPGDLADACRASGILFNPHDDIDAESIYIQIIRPGIVALPREFEMETIGVFGNLTVKMPYPELLAAAKLVRGSEIDIDDIVWWINQRGFDISDIELAVSRLPRENHRETAKENLVLAQLVVGGDEP